MSDLNTASDSATDMDKVVARIQKILSRAKTGTGATEAEADTAMKLAQELALKHNLDIAAIEAAQAQSATNAPAERVKDELKGRAMYKWQRQLAKFVAEANFCYHLVHERQTWQDGYYKPDVKAIKAAGKNPKDFKTLTQDDAYEQLTWQDRHGGFYIHVDGRYKTDRKHIFVGRKSNVITAQLMFQYLTQTIEDNVPIENNAERLSRSAMSWKEGCADRICERLAARRQDLIAKHDARVRQEEADRQAEREKAAADKRAAEKRVLPAHHESEVKAGFAASVGDSYDRTGDKPELEEQDRPEDDEEPWMPEGEDVEEPEVGSALVLASVYDETERDANYELAHNMEPGTLARWKQEREERQRQRDEAEASTQAEEQIGDVEKPVKEETERQRKAREKREREEQAKNRRRWAREDEAAARREARESEKRDWSMYRAGAEKGKSIGLDSQVKAGVEPKKLG